MPLTFSILKKSFNKKDDGFGSTALSGSDTRATDSELPINT